MFSARFEAPQAHTAVGYSKGWQAARWTRNNGGPSALGKLTAFSVIYVQAHLYIFLHPNAL